MSREDLRKLAEAIADADGLPVAGADVYGIEALARAYLEADDERERLRAEVVRAAATYLTGGVSEAELRRQVLAAECAEKGSFLHRIRTAEGECDALRAEVEWLERGLRSQLNIAVEATEDAAEAQRERNILRAEVARLRNERDGARAVSREFADDFAALQAKLARAREALQVLRMNLAADRQSDYFAAIDRALTETNDDE